MRAEQDLDEGDLERRLKTSRADRPCAGLRGGVCRTRCCLLYGRRSWPCAAGSRTGGGRSRVISGRSVDGQIYEEMGQEARAMVAYSASFAINPHQQDVADAIARIKNHKRARRSKRVPWQFHRVEAGNDGADHGRLGPTNTGKTHYAIERMLAHRSGSSACRCGFWRGRSMTGSSSARPVLRGAGDGRGADRAGAHPILGLHDGGDARGLGADFLALDEIQLCADPERGMCSRIACSINAAGMRPCCWARRQCARDCRAGAGRAFTRRERFPS